MRVSVFTHLCAIPDMSDFQYAPQPNIPVNDITSSHSYHKFIKISIIVDSVACKYSSNASLLKARVVIPPDSVCTR